MKSPAAPHDLDAERAVLGAILMRNPAYAEIRDRLTTQDFYRHAHGFIFDAMGALHKAGDVILCQSLPQVLVAFVLKQLDVLVLVGRIEQELRMHKPELLVILVNASLAKHEDLFALNKRPYGDGPLLES